MGILIIMMGNALKDPNLWELGSMFLIMGNARLISSAVRGCVKPEGPSASPLACDSNTALGSSLH